jgi:hypothetical protein
MRDMEEHDVGRLRAAEYISTGKGIYVTARALQTYVRCVYIQAVSKM